MHDHIHISLARRAAAALALTSMFALLPGLASADGHRRGLPAGPGKQAYTTECGSCHVAFPPQLLSATGWKRVMGGLGKHFGDDASLDPATAATISAYLETNAGSDRRFGTDTLRISETSWFRREHDEVPASVWKLPQTKSAANCAACHTGAAQGDYSEHSVRLPVASRR